MSFFRNEVTLSLRPKLHGDVLLVHPIKYTAFAGLAVLITILGSVLVVKGEYSRREQAIGHLVTTQRVVRLYPRRAGIVSALNVQEGAPVELNDQLATIIVEETGLAGSSSEVQSIEFHREELRLVEHTQSQHQWLDTPHLYWFQLVEPSRPLNLSLQLFLRVEN